MHKAVTMNLFSRLAVLSITVLICVSCDQSSKMWAQSHLQGHSSISYFDSIFNLVYAENSGTMLGFGSMLPENLRFIFFVLFVGFALVAATVFVLVKPRHNLTLLAISLVVGGGISNLIDRLIQKGSVIDFMLIKIGSLESGIFNVADLAITLGISTLCFSFISSRGKNR
jgi:signal peptidase II